MLRSALWVASLMGALALCSCASSRGESAAADSGVADSGALDAGSCASIGEKLYRSIEAAGAEADRTCATQTDCVELTLGVSCAPGCGSDGFSTNGRDQLFESLRNIEADYCPSYSACDSHLDASCLVNRFRGSVYEADCVDGRCSIVEVGRKQ